jgi:hypothetical protein
MSAGDFPPYPVSLAGGWERVPSPLEVIAETIATDHTRRIIDLETRVANFEAALAKMEESK